MHHAVGLRSEIVRRNQAYETNRGVEHPPRSASVGWAERREAHRSRCRRMSMGFAGRSAHPTDLRIHGSGENAQRACQRSPKPLSRLSGPASPAQSSGVNPEPDHAVERGIGPVAHASDMAVLDPGCSGCSRYGGRNRSRHAECAPNNGAAKSRVRADPDDRPKPIRPAVSSLEKPPLISCHGTAKLLSPSGNVQIASRWSRNTTMASMVNRWRRRLVRNAARRNSILSISSRDRRSAKFTAKKYEPAGTKLRRHAVTAALLPCDWFPPGLTLDRSGGAVRASRA